MLQTPAIDVLLAQSSAIAVLAQSSAIVSTYHTMAEL